MVLSSLSLAVVTCGDGRAEKDEGDVSPASRVSAKELTAARGESSPAPGPYGAVLLGFLGGLCSPGVGLWSLECLPAQDIL